MTILPENEIYQALSTNGDGTGVSNVIGDYSSTQEEFYITPAGNRAYHISRLLVFIEDQQGDFTADNYGGLSSGLTNGIRCVVKNQHGNEVLDLTSGANIKSNAEWGMHCYDITKSDFGSGDDFLHVRWTFANSVHPVYLPKGYRLSILINDDLTGLIAHTFIVQGYRE